MNHSELINYIKWAPLFYAAYFLRIYPTSFYVFDVYFIILLCKILPRFGNSVFKQHLPCGLLFFFAILIGLSNGQEPGEQSDLLGFLSASYRYFQIVSFVAILTWIARTNKARVELQPFYWIFLFCSAFPLLYAIAGIIFFPEQVLVAGRLAGYFGNPNAFGSYICLLIAPLSIILKGIGQLNVRVVAVLAFGLLGSFGLVSSGSNSYWILCALSLSVVVMLGIKSWAAKIALIAVAVIMGVLTLTFLANSALIENLDDFRGLKRTSKLWEAISGSQSTDELGSSSLRVELLLASLRLWSENWMNFLFGIGLGQSPLLIGPEFGGRVTAHNAIVVLLLETGLVGFGCLIRLLLIPAKALRITGPTVSLFICYWVAGMGTPHVYLPFLWGGIIYACFVSVCQSKGRGGIRRNRASTKQGILSKVDL